MRRGGQAGAGTGGLDTFESSDTRSPSFASLTQHEEVYSLEKLNQSSFLLRDVRHSRWIRGTLPRNRGPGKNNTGVPPPLRLTQGTDRSTSHRKDLEGFFSGETAGTERKTNSLASNQAVGTRCPQWSGMSKPHSGPGLCTGFGAAPLKATQVLMKQTARKRGTRDRKCRAQTGTLKAHVHDNRASTDNADI